MSNNNGRVMVRLAMLRPLYLLKIFKSKCEKLPLSGDGGAEGWGRVKVVAWIYKSADLQGEGFGSSIW